MRTGNVYERSATVQCLIGLENGVRKAKCGNVRQTTLIGSLRSIKTESGQEWPIRR